MLKIPEITNYPWETTSGTNAYPHAYPYDYSYDRIHWMGYARGENGKSYTIEIRAKSSNFMGINIRKILESLEFMVLRENVPTDTSDIISGDSYKSEIKKEENISNLKLLLK